MGCCQSTDYFNYEELKDKKHAGFSIWLSHEKTVEQLERMMTSYSDPYIILMPDKNLLCFYYRQGKICRKFNIPYIGYLLPRNLDSFRLEKFPPGIQIAREDLWNTELFKQWSREYDES